MIVLKAHIQRRGQHFVFPKQGARKHEPLVGRLQPGQFHFDVIHHVGHQQPGGVVKKVVVLHVLRVIRPAYIDLESHQAQNALPLATAQLQLNAR